jgi:hypothetical protein
VGVRSTAEWKALRQGPFLVGSAVAVIDDRLGGGAIGGHGPLSAPKPLPVIVTCWPAAAVVLRKAARRVKTPGC